MLPLAWSEEAVGVEIVNMKPAPYRRRSPSPRYERLLSLYKQMHDQGEPDAGRPPERTYAGLNCLPQADHIRALVLRTGARTLLDYGSGKGRQYEQREVRGCDGNTYPNLQTYWGVDSITCYDPAYEQFSALPQGTFDGVISTDVLEHCPEEDLSWIIDEVFSLARLFVFANVACYSAGKRLATGENAHCTLRSPEWWTCLVEEVASRHPGVRCRFHFELREKLPSHGLGPRLLDLVRKPRMGERIVVLET